MITKTKRALALLLAIALLCGLGLTTQVSAADITGTLGLSIDFTIDSAGLLTLSGRGATGDYLPDETPLGPYADRIKALVVEDGITYLGSAVFSNLTNLKTAQIADSVKDFGSSVFLNCTSLTAVNVPEGVQYIYTLFEGCEALEEMVLPESANTLFRTFYGCTSLKNVTMPSKLYSIRGAFYGCTSLEEITIPATVSWIEEESFYRCSSLQRIVIAGAETNVSQGGFGQVSKDLIFQCPKNSQAHIFAAENDFLVQLPGESAPIREPGTGTLGVNVRYRLDENGQLTLSGTGETGGYYQYGAPPTRAFADQVKSVVVEDGITFLGEGLFQGMSSLTSAVIADSVTSTATSLFAYCNALQSVKLPAGLRELESSMFLDCKALSSVTLPGGLVTIGGGSFQSCSSLVNLSLPAGVTQIGAYAFRFSGLSQLTLPASVTSIGREAFVNCGSLASIDIPAGVTDIGVGVFSGNGEDFYISCAKDSAAHVYAAERNILFRLPGAPVPVYNPNAGTLGADVRFSIDSKGLLTVSGSGKTGAYTADAPLDAYADLIKQVVVEEGISYLGDQLFSYLPNLVSAQLPQSAALGSFLFSNCKSLQSVRLPAGLEEIPHSTFSDSGLTQFDVPPGVKTIAHSAFFGCKALKTITLPEGLETIGLAAFQGCSALEKMVLPESVSFISMVSFKDCSALREINIPRNVSEIVTEAFENCTSLERIVLPNGIETIAVGAFRGCSSLKDITIPYSVTEVKSSAFYGVSSEFKILCTQGGPMHKYARDNNMPFELVYIYELLEDEETSVEVEAPDGTIPPRVDIEVDELDSATGFEAGPGNSVHSVYDIDLARQSQIIQPNGKVIVRLPLGTAKPSQNANWNVYHVVRDSKGNVTQKTKMDAEVVEVDGAWYFEFETDHFSVYAIADDIAVVPVKTIFGTKYESTFGNWLMFFLLFGFIWMWFA